ncbi:MAG: protein-L-isoaspartate O-methyltransferase, partial [Gammaproteobacteria bacterium]|nr:protein-L-isoaspartate O-methyltransferase [Gammaproteobacteria bacterium]
MTSMRTRLRLIESLKKAGIHNEIVLNALSEIPRHLFVDEAIAHKAYENIALPIGFGQTISQPYIVARMTQAALGDDLHLKSVLEIGTGSGYQAAVLSKVADRVYTIERIKDLLDLAKQRFNNLRLYNVKTMYNDGYTGWVDHA